MSLRDRFIEITELMWLEARATHEDTGKAEDAIYDIVNEARDSCLRHIRKANENNTAIPWVKSSQIIKKLLEEIKQKEI